MKRTVQIFLLALGALLALEVVADEGGKDQKKKLKIIPIPVYLGNSDIDSGVISKPLFDSLVKQGLTARDSGGRIYDVKSFMFTFCERNLYEDSVGNPVIITDYLSEFCFDNKLKGYQLQALLERSKWGDTVIFEKIMLEAADSTKAQGFGKAMKLIIGR